MADKSGDIYRPGNSRNTYNEATEGGPHTSSSSQTGNGQKKKAYDVPIQHLTIRNGEKKKKMHNGCYLSTYKLRIELPAALEAPASSYCMNIL